MIYCDLTIDDTVIWTGVPCLNGVLIGSNPYLDFSGYLFFQDGEKNDDPVYTGLGSRFYLFYYPVSGDPVIVPLNPVASQQLKVILDSQNCTFAFYERDVEMIWSVVTPYYTIVVTPSTSVLTPDPYDATVLTLDVQLTRVDGYSGIVAMGLPSAPWGSGVNMYINSPASEFAQLAGAYINDNLVAPSAQTIGFPAPPDHFEIHFYGSTLTWSQDWRAALGGVRIYGIDSTEIPTPSNLFTVDITASAPAYYTITVAPAVNVIDVELVPMTLTLAATINRFNGHIAPVDITIPPLVVSPDSAGICIESPISWAGKYNGVFINDEEIWDPASEIVPNAPASFDMNLWAQYAGWSTLTEGLWGFANGGVQLTGNDGVLPPVLSNLFTVDTAAPDPFWDCPTWLTPSGGLDIPADQTINVTALPGATYAWALTDVMTFHGSGYLIVVEGGTGHKSITIEWMFDTSDDAQTALTHMFTLVCTVTDTYGAHVLSQAPVMLPS